MNIAESEIACQMIAKTCGCKDKNRKVTYSIIDSYHNLCSDKRDIILAQIDACERVSKYTKDGRYQFIPDIDLLHEVATKISRNNWDINIFSSAIRHRNILYKKGITDDQIDSLIENVDEHCFKRQIRVEHFVKLV